MDGHKGRVCDREHRHRLDELGRDALFGLFVVTVRIHRPSRVEQIAEWREGSGLWDAVPTKTNALIVSTPTLARPAPPSERREMPADPDEQGSDAVDLQGERADIGIPDADAVGGEKGEEREEHDAEELGREAHGDGPFRL